jgi:hypothetical protein
MKTQAVYNRYLRLLKVNLATETDAALLNRYYSNPRPDFHQQCLLKFQCRMELIRRGYRPYSIAGADVALIPKRYAHEKATCPRPGTDARSRRKNARPSGKRTHPPRVRVRSFPEQTITQKVLV